MNHLADVIFRAAVWRSFHFAPLSIAIAIAVVAGAVILWRTRS